MRAVSANGWQEIDGLRGDWLDISRKAANATPFADPDFCRLWLMHRDPEARPVAIALRNERGEVQALAPLCIASTKKAGLSIERLRFMVAVSWLDSDFLLRDPAGDGVSQLLEEGVRNCDPDMLDLFAIQCSSPSLVGIEQSARRAGYTFEALSPSPWRNALVHLDGTWEEYLARRSPKTRYAMRRMNRNMDAWGRAEIERHSGPERLSEDLAAMESIMAKSWKDPSSYLEGGFWREFIELMSLKGWLSLYILRINDEPAAFLVLLRHERTIYWMQTGYDSALAHLSPGAYLIAKAMQDCFEHRASETRLDFLTAYPFLERLSDSTGARVRIRCFPQDLKGRILSLGFRLGNSLKPQGSLRWEQVGSDRTEGNPRYPSSRRELQGHASGDAEGSGDRSG